LIQKSLVSVSESEGLRFLYDHFGLFVSFILTVMPLIWLNIGRDTFFFDNTGFALRSGHSRANQISELLYCLLSLSEPKRLKMLLNHVGTFVSFNLIAIATSLAKYRKVTLTSVKLAKPAQLNESLAQLVIHLFFGSGSSLTCCDYVRM
jgi:hypothetical protein